MYLNSRPHAGAEVAAAARRGSGRSVAADPPGARRDAGACVVAFRALAVLAGLAIGVITGMPEAWAGPAQPGRAWPEAEALFHRDPRWLGADAALSVPLDAERTAWFFGDTFVAPAGAGSRAQSEMLRNTIAIQTGRDPRTAAMTFHWRQDDAGSPASFFAERGRRWYWPGHGIRLEEGPLVVFLYSMAATPGQGLGFASAGYAVAVIDNPDEPAASWKPRITDAAPAGWDAVPATALVRDGDHVVALAIRQQGTHAGALVRYPAAQLATGRVDGAEWWGGDEQGWRPASSLGAEGPVFVLDDAGAEGSLHWDARTGSFVHVASYGFGASTIGLRTAPALTGPWSSPDTVYRPPESDRSRPFVYAAKAHPEIAGPGAGDLVVTYAANSFEFADLLTEQGGRDLYWPRFVAVRLGQPASSPREAAGGGRFGGWVRRAAAARAAAGEGLVDWQPAEEYMGQESGKQLLDFAARYTAAWCSNDADSVAAHYAPGGSLAINGATPAVGRESIAAAAQEFMTAFPDLQVYMDGLQEQDGEFIYRWTLEGTHAGPGGSGRKVRISGHEQWRIGPDGLIARSLGHYDAAEFQRQIGQGAGDE